MKRRMFLGALLAAAAAPKGAVAQQEAPQSTDAHAGHSGHAPQGAEVPRWTGYPTLIRGRTFGRTGVRYQAYNLHAMEGQATGSFEGGEAAMQAASSALEISTEGEFIVKTGEAGGYYLVSVQGHGPGGENANASTIHYFSNPAPAPREMLAAARPGLEIVPAVLPREHGQFRENETWRFRVANDGKPVAGMAVALETSNGSKAEFKTGPDGVAEITFPQDSKDIPKERWSHGRPPPSGFVLAVRDGGLLATFNGTYGRDAYAGTSLLFGFGFMLVGMAAATPFLRKPKTRGDGA